MHVRSLVLLGVLSGMVFHGPAAPPPDLEKQVYYHVFQRSFYDADGDGHGDLKGLTSKLGYLQDLGVTTILMVPLYHSDFYHNYFPIDFEKIDPEYGTLADYLELVRQAHRRGLKIIMDMEIHYVTAEHLWYRESYGRPESPYTEYIRYNDRDNLKPESIIFNLESLRSYDGRVIKFCTTNLRSEKVIRYHRELFQYWVDPNRDGKFDDGVDGFRIDHIMDDLDGNGSFTNLLRDFWKPLFDGLRQLNPRLQIVGEQADWGYGQEYFQKGDLDLVFSFPLRAAILELDPAKIAAAATETYRAAPPGKSSLVLIENHDTDRFASVVGGDPAKLRLGAALCLLLKGVPLIYYGQELGMRGKTGDWGPTDGNHIPLREAFEWYRTVAGPGMALWYKDSGPWWEISSLEDNDGISLAEQKGDSASLWHYYRKLIHLRRSTPALQSGSIRFLEAAPAKVLAFLREEGQQRVLVVANLDSAPAQARITLGPGVRSASAARDLLHGTEVLLPEDPAVAEFRLQPGQVRVLQLR